MPDSPGETIIKVGRFALAALFGSVLTVFTIFTLFPENTTKWSPADNYGVEKTWYKLPFNDESNFTGSWGSFVLGAFPQNECINIKGISGWYGDPNDGRSVKLYDEFQGDHPDWNLPEGMKVHIYWGRACSDWRPYGVITVPANVKSVKVPRLNYSSENYEVFNNFEQQDGGDRSLGGHVYGIRWSIPE
jgi:hypothetical protein